MIPSSARNLKPNLSEEKFFDRKYFLKSIKVWSLKIDLRLALGKWGLMRVCKVLSQIITLNSLRWHMYVKCRPRS